jgi:hypothetical protein
MGSKFEDLLTKEGETLSYYAHSFESSRNSTTNLKVSNWAAATNITAVVRSQGKVDNPKDVALNETDMIVILTTTAITKLSVVKFQNGYYDLLFVEEQFWKGTRQYFKATCMRRLEFLGA